MDMNFPIVKALVVDGVVVEAYLVWEITPNIEDWLTAPVEVGPNWTYNGETFSPPVEE
jgi:hypothetical protein